VKKTKEKSKKLEIKRWKLYCSVVFVAGFLLLPIIGYCWYFSDKVYFGVTFLGENLGGKTFTEAKMIVDQKSISVVSEKIDIVSDKKYNLSLAETGLTIDTKTTIDSITSTFRTQNILRNNTGMLSVLRNEVKVMPIVVWKDDSFDQIIKTINNESSFTKAKPAEYQVNSGEITIIPSVSGYVIDEDLLKNELISVISGKNSIKVPLTLIEPAFRTINAEESLEKAKILLNVDILLKYDLTTYKIDGEDFVTWVAIYKNLDAYKIEPNGDKYLTFFEKISKSIDREVKNPILKIEGDRVTEFVPPTDGRKLDSVETLAKITQAVNNLKNDEKSVSLDLVVRVTKPEDFENNQYGIREFLARGVSDFSGSSSGRIHNIKLASSRINGSLVAPGEEFSFNRRLGDISRANGYQSAYVIENGKTVLGDGGGVCQVSTTAFRAALFAGLEITARSPHAYRVGYYEKLGFKPGLDAAIYYPNLDFRFKNNTSKHILISAYVVGTRLTFDIYGTSDERQVTISEPVVTNIKPAPEPRYQDDPTLPRGTTKQVDFAASGATSKFSQTVVQGGETIINKQFTSVFRPWQAVFLVGTKDN